MEDLRATDSRQLFAAQLRRRAESYVFGLTEPAGRKGLAGSVFDFVSQDFPCALDFIGTIASVLVKKKSAD
jgi:hypothetical protein